MIPAAAVFVLAVVTAALWPRPAAQTRADAVRPAIPEMATSEPVHVVPAVQMRAAAPRTPKPHSTVKRASREGDTHAPSHTPASKPGFFSRPILRIVLK
jgi:hypothetical protein